MTLARDLPPAQVAFVAWAGLVLWVLALASPTVGVVAGVALFLLGVPHGAVEAYGGRRHVPGLVYTALYLAVGVGLFAWWTVAPLFALAGFLLLSAWHFARDEPRLRTVGPWVVLGSGLVFPAETLGVFEAITGEVVPVSTGLFRTAATVSALALMVEALRRDALPYAAVLVAIFVLLPPVAAVALYFLGVHSFREMGLAAEEAGGWGRLLRRYAPFAVPALLGGGAVLALAALGHFPLVVAAGVAVAFAAPHMLPLAGVRPKSAKPPARPAH